MCSTLMDRKMDQPNSSDKNPTMMASKTFDSILDQIQKSNLNFQLRISPFSANISIKRSPVKDMSGAPLLLPRASPNCSHPASVAETEILASKTLLETSLKSLKVDYENALLRCEASDRRIIFLENKAAIKGEPNEALKNNLIEKNVVISDLSIQIKQLSEDKEYLKGRFDDLNAEIQDLETSNKKQKEISNKFNKELSDARVKFQKEKTEISKEYRAELKVLRKDLGEETRQKLKVEKKLRELVTNSAHPVPDFTPRSNESSTSPSASQPSIDTAENSEDTVCSICATPIVNYIQKYFEGEPFSPACDKCDDDSSKFDDCISELPVEVQAFPDSVDIDTKHPFTKRGFNRSYLTINPANSSSASANCSHNQQCITRQPFTPPLPTITPLINEFSLYHLKTMAGELDWGSTCGYCMRIEHEKYGCESCVWIKCYGELHGFPDIDPDDYKKHL